MSTVPAATLLGALLLAGCATSTLPLPVQPAGPGLVAQGSLEDPAGDLLDGDDNLVDTPAYIDIRSLVAVADGATLRLTLTLAGALPAATDPDVERLLYWVAIHTDGDAIPERDDLNVGVGYTARLHSRGALGYQPGIRDWRGSDFPDELLGPDFPGTADVAGDTIVLTVPLAALRNPHVIRIGAWTTRFPNPPRGRWGDPWDTLPDSDFGGATEDWLVLGS
ncbi:MAG: hypothetical protein MUQ32_02835 [Chloroflexi bacterium]|nr:hypothetical protein [Chloroflexota bacterium]